MWLHLLRMRCKVCFNFYTIIFIKITLHNLIAILRALQKQEIFNELFDFEKERIAVDAFKYEEETRKKKSREYMMQNNYRCQVYLWDQLVGEIVLVKESIYFKYNEAFDLNISPIALPLSSAQYKRYEIMRDAKENSFKGKIIVLKGSMSKPRLKIKEILESLGVKVSVSFTLVLI